MNPYQCRLTRHGRHHLELGVIYPLSKTQKRSLYRVDAFFFTPYPLGLNKSRYGVQRFFSDLNAYIRFTPASLSFAKMTDPACALSPLTRIDAMLDSAALPTELDTERLLYETRAFVNTFNGQLRETRRLVVELARRNAAPEDILPRVTALLADIDACLLRFRDLRVRFFSPAVQPPLRLAAAWADESVSLKTEKELHRLYTAFEKFPGLGACGEALKPFLEREQSYRRRQNFKTVVDPAHPETGEHFLYRESMLKKWAQTALYLDFVPDKLVSQVVQILAGAAAAAAMAFAVLATFLAQQFFAMYSVPWMILIVVAYIFKDRIKETMRAFLLAFVPKLVADESLSLVDQRIKRKVGGMRSRVRFCTPRQVPASVVELRNASGNPFNSMMPPENVIHYHSTVRLDNEELLHNHPWLEAIANILRLRLDAWLVGMDDPFDIVRFIRDGNVEEMKASRVYHVYVVVRLVEGKDGAHERLFKYILVLNRDGLMRIEGIANAID